MWIQVRTMDGKKSIQIDKLSKLTTIKELKDKIASEFEIPSDRQRLFFSGKQVSFVDTFIAINLLFFIFFNGCINYQIFSSINLILFAPQEIHKM